MTKISSLPKKAKHLYLDVIGDEKVNVYESRNHVYIYYVLDCGVFRVSKYELKELSSKMLNAYEEFKTAYEEFRTTDSKE